MGAAYINSGQIGMASQRKSKRVHWELMLQLEEAGEEDMCSLLNELMGHQPYFGTGTDLTEYFEAITALEKQGELTVREYYIQDGRTVYGDVLSGGTSRCVEALFFDSASRRWKWKSATRQMVEVV